MTVVRRPNSTSTSDPASSRSNAARSGARWAVWEDDAVVDAYRKHGVGGGGHQARTALAATLQRTAASVQMRLANVHAVVTGRGLVHVAEQTRVAARSQRMVCTQ